MIRSAVAIVGAGPAGAALAALLARKGLSVTLVERAARARRKVCGEYLCPPGVSLLRELKLGRAASGRPVRGMYLGPPQGEPVWAPFPQGAEGQAHARDLFDAGLIEEAEAAGARLLRGRALEKMRFLNGHWILSVGDLELEARFLVGADGRQSFVAREFSQTLPLARRRVALHFFANAPAGDFGEMHILPGGAYLGISPPKAWELNLSLVCDAEEIGAGPGAGKAAAEAILRKSPRLAARFLPLLGPVQVAYPISHRTNAIAGSSWALVGDAAGFLDPLTGEGLYQAILSAQLLAEEFPGALASPLRLARALRSYERQHEAALASKRRIHRLFQLLIRSPRACEWVGDYLRADPARAEAFIGVIGNVLSPREGLAELWRAAG